MKNYLTFCLFILLIVPGCKNKDDENIGLLPSADYPYTYPPLSQQEMTAKLQEFNAINTFENLRLDEFGMLRGFIPVNLAAGLDSLTVKNNISFILKTYGPFLGIINSDSINLETDIFIILNPGVTVTLSAYFKHNKKTSSNFYIKQYKLSDRNIVYANVSFRFSEQENQMQIYGRWYPKVYVPEIAIKNQQEALNIGIQYINKNHKEVGPLRLSTVEKEKFKKVIFPYPSNRGIEMRECWEVIFWENTVEILVDTQTGEVVYFLQYGDMI